VLSSQDYYDRIATPFQGRFTRDDLAAPMRKLGSDTSTPAVGAQAEYVAEPVNQSTRNRLNVLVDPSAESCD
jgi:hypothetical protein